MSLWGNSSSQTVFNTLKGNIKTAPINLKTSSILNPKILNGSNSSQTMGNKKIMTIASGQHMTNKIHHRRKPIKDIDLIYSFTLSSKLIARINK